MSAERPSSRPLVSASIDSDERLRPYAQARFPGGVAVSRDVEPNAAAAETARLVAAGTSVIYDAAFIHNGLLAVIDVLVWRRDRWQVFLQRPNTRIREKLLADAAIHEQILRGAGLLVGDIILLLLNPEYIRSGPVDPVALFTEVRVSRRLRYVQELIPARLGMLRGMAAKRARAEARARKVEAGIELPPLPRPPALKPISDPAPAAALDLELDRGLLRAFLDGLEYPLHFMDFEAYQVPIPEWDGHWPFRQIPFQFSVHRLEAPGGELHHEGFIAPVNVEPTAAFAEALLAATGDRGSVLVYNRDSEGLILDQIEAGHPRWAEPVAALRARLVDLQDPFSNGAVRIPAIGNKLSLKFVLPALLPHMNYDALAIGTGVDANRAYLAVRSSTDSRFVADTIEALHEYCRLDTLAMVRILERLYELAE